ncbi:MAG: hypothetical protein AAGJ91_18870 [Pseudomonadota bacterium]
MAYGIAVAVLSWSRVLVDFLPELQSVSGYHVRLVWHVSLALVLFLFSVLLIRRFDGSTTKVAFFLVFLGVITSWLTLRFTDQLQTWEYYHEFQLPSIMNIAWIFLSGAFPLIVALVSKLAKDYASENRQRRVFLDTSFALALALIWISEASMPLVGTRILIDAEMQSTHNLSWEEWRWEHDYRTRYLSLHGSLVIYDQDFPFAVTGAASSLEVRSVQGWRAFLDFPIITSSYRNEFVSPTTLEVDRHLTLQVDQTADLSLPAFGRNRITMTSSTGFLELSYRELSPSPFRDVANSEMSLSTTEVQNIILKWNDDNIAEYPLTSFDGALIRGIPTMYRFDNERGAIRAIIHSEAIGEFVPPSIAHQGHVEDAFGLRLLLVDPTGFNFRTRVTELEVRDVLAGNITVGGENTVLSNEDRLSLTFQGDNAGVLELDRANRRVKVTGLPFSFRLNDEHILPKRLDSWGWLIQGLLVCLIFGALADAYRALAPKKIS